MPKEYKVTWYESEIVRYAAIIKADSKEDAIKLAQDGDCDTYYVDSREYDDSCEPYDFNAEEGDA